MFLLVLVPLLRMATHTAVTDSLQSYFSNPFLAFLLSKLQFEILAAAVTLLLRVETAPWVAPALAGDSAAAPSGSTGSIGKLQNSSPVSWQPEGWLDVIEPCVFLVYELTERFQVGFDGGDCTIPTAATAHTIISMQHFSYCCLNKYAEL